MINNSYPNSKDVTMANAIVTSKNYHNWIFSVVGKYLIKDGVTLEIGAGHGEYTKKLINISKKVIVTDIDEEMTSKLREIFSNKKNIEILLMNGIDVKKISEPVDNILTINVIEHIKDDIAFVKNCFSVLNKGGRLIIFAPAFHFLYSNIDKQAGHFRRYSKNDIKSLLKNSGFKDILVRYFNFAGFWGWLINKYFKSGVNSKSTNFQVNIFNNYLTIFRILDIFSFCLGQSLLIIGEKYR